MASASFKVRADGLKRLATRLGAIRPQVQEALASRGAAAIIGQAIADNFNKEGPGWKPLKKETIMRSLSKATKAKVLSGKLKASDSRKILQRTGLLKKSATTPGAVGNTFTTRGFVINWGTALVYANIHNRGGTIKHPGTNNGFGIKGFKIRPHQIKIPRREYLYLNDNWKHQLDAFCAQKLREVLKRAINSG